MAPTKGNNTMQEIFCSLCAANADMAIVDGVTYTVCGNCGNIHIAETEQYIKFPLTMANGMALVPRKLFVMALAMEAIYEVYDEIFRELKKRFNTDVPMGE